jgi:tRNA(Ile2)-agmatinylcytidine synthase
MQNKIMQIGIDDTDSTRRGCTTYVAALLVEKLVKTGAELIDYPSLVRLNPNVPWKTRGNGALSLRIKHDPRITDQIKNAVIDIVENQADLKCKGTDPGIVFLQRLTVPREIKEFSKKTVTGIVKLEQALKLTTKYCGEAIGYNERRGIIGALAAIGETFEADYTYEVLTYRMPQNIGTKRRVDETSIFTMDRLTQPYTFNNVDYEKNRIIITPRGPDPILFGIRGETPEVVRQALDIARPLEPIERWMIFRTNQGTDAHIIRAKKLDTIKQYQSVRVKGTVVSPPRNVPLRHVIFTIKDETSIVDCAAYEPTGNLHNVARDLIVGDYIDVSGAVRYKTARPLTINLEKIRPLKLAPILTLENPFCRFCGKRLKSMGKNQGFRCPKCGSKCKNASKIKVEKERKLKKKEIYVTSARSQRHLTKPLSRYGLEKHGEPAKMIEDWRSP